MHLKNLCWNLQRKLNKCQYSYDKAWTIRTDSPSLVCVNLDHLGIPNRYLSEWHLPLSWSYTN